MKYPNAVALATVDEQLRPAVRIVLLKHIDEKGFQFFTNYEGRKGRELLANQQAALCFFWDALGRQVRVEGKVEKLDSASSDAYFQSRPRRSQLGAWASKQSRVIESREILEQEMEKLEQQFPHEVPRPDHWGGFLLTPTSFEFWLEQDNRLHDRFEYLPASPGQWKINRLSP